MPLDFGFPPYSCQDTAVWMYGTLTQVNFFEVLTDDKARDEQKKKGWFSFMEDLRTGKNVFVNQVDKSETVPLMKQLRGAVWYVLAHAYVDDKRSSLGHHFVIDGPNSCIYESFKNDSLCHGLRRTVVTIPEGENLTSDDTLKFLSQRLVETYGSAMGRDIRIDGMLGTAPSTAKASA